MVQLKDKAHRLCSRVKRLAKRITNRPDNFVFLKKDENGQYTVDGNVIHAEEVGPERTVDYLTCHDIMQHAIRRLMTDLKYIEGLDANAVYVDYNKFQRLSESIGRTYIQPVKILDS